MQKPQKKLAKVPKVASGAHALAIMVSKCEGKKVELGIGQIKEVIRIVGCLLRMYPVDVLKALIG